MALVAVLALVVGVVGSGSAEATGRSGRAPVTMLTQDDFRFGTYIIDQPGVYRLAEDISFNPNSPASLTQALETGAIPPELAAAMDLSVPVDAYHAGRPLFTQFQTEDGEPFTPGGPLDPRYEPAAYGLGFFAAIAVQADDVVIDLNGHTLAQHPEHALLQRFFAVIELGDQPFVPQQGPFGFGDDLEIATNTTIKNGTLGLSAHHGIHGNGPENVRVLNVDFVDYEVGAIALNGVQGLTVTNATATNRKDVPVLGTFSSAQFIKVFIDELARNGSSTTLTVDGEALTVTDIRDRLIEAINATHHDIIAEPKMAEGRAQIDPVAHPVESGLFNNPFGLIDGNSYSFLTNHLGLAVNGFPTTPDGQTAIPSRDVSFRNVHVIDQESFINEVVALDAEEFGLFGDAVIDPVGAVFQVFNTNPDTGEPMTTSSLDPSEAAYTGNPVANAQALVAKATFNGEFDQSNLDLSRMNMTDRVLGWVEADEGSETLNDINAHYLCNGDSMFHVNKGAIAYKMDAADGVRMTNTTVDGLVNLGRFGHDICGDYSDGTSHQAALLPGYGGAVVRGYTFSGSRNVIVNRSSVQGLHSLWGSGVGFDVIADSSELRIVNARVNGVDAGSAGAIPESSPTAASEAIGFRVGADAQSVTIVRGCAHRLHGHDSAHDFVDLSGDASIVGTCR